MRHYRGMRLLGSLLLPATLLASGCSPIPQCPAYDCVDLLALEFSGEAGDLPPSTYEIVVTIHDEDYLVVCASPPPEGDGDWWCEDPEEDGQRLSVYADESSDEDVSFTVMIEGGFEIDGPTAVGVSVIAGDAPLLDESYEVDFSDRGPGSCASCQSRQQPVVLPL
ncbi:MAG: hypothetical protein AB1Z98_37000 [Nannocystaceae bacterium]